MICEHMKANSKPKMEFCKRQDQLLTRTERISPEAGAQFVPCAKAELHSRESETSMIERYRNDRRWITAQRFLIATLTFVVFSWIAFGFCIYVIWAKCRDS